MIGESDEDFVLDVHEKIKINRERICERISKSGNSDMGIKGERRMGQDKVEERNPVIPVTHK